MQSYWFHLDGENEIILVPFGPIMLVPFGVRMKSYWFHQDVIILVPFGVRMQSYWFLWRLLHESYLWINQMVKLVQVTHKHEITSFMN